MKIVAEDFLARPLDALSFYSILPTDGWVVTDGPKVSESWALLDRLDRSDVEVHEELLDLALLWLLGAPEIEAAAAVRTADHVSRLYARLLAGGKRDRARRMKLQQLNFFLRDLVDRTRRSTGRTVAHISTTAPWDWLPLDKGSIFIVSGEKGLRWTVDGQSGMADAGLPSQLDPLDGDRISVGSIFSDGAVIWSPAGISKVEHDQPLVLLFAWAGDELAVAYDGTVLRPADGQVVGRLALSQVDRVRKIGSRLIAADWSLPDQVTVMELETMQSFRTEIGPVILLNDICASAGGYYAICKQQGRVFTFDQSLVLTGEQLAFGRGEGRLFDPLTLRIAGDDLNVINWVTGTRVALTLPG